MFALSTKKQREETFAKSSLSVYEKNWRWMMNSRVNPEHGSASWIYFTVKFCSGLENKRNLNINQALRPTSDFTPRVLPYQAASTSHLRLRLGSPRRLFII